MEIRVYITNLAKYNNGVLQGKWIDLPLDEDELQAELKEVLGTDEEIFITDYEAPFKIDEYDSITDLNALAEKLEELDEDHDIPRFIYLVNDGCTYEQAFEEYEDVDFYPGLNLKALAEQFVEEGLFGEIPERLQYYIDYDAIARDLGVDYTEEENGCFRRG